MSNSNNNRSLFLYTGLIFLVAIIMIIIAFFGQSNLEKNQPIKESVTSIEDKTERLSEDNRLLLEQNQSLQDTNKLLTEQVSAMRSDEEEYQKQINNNDLLLDVYNMLYKGNKKSAAELLKTINADELTEKQKTFYTILQKKCK